MSSISIQTDAETRKEMLKELKTATGTRREALRFLLGTLSPDEREEQESPDGYGPLDQHKA